jgi:4a-hydroxytetrahydrobiopterin dehydratase
MSLADKSCMPCRGGVPPLAPDAARRLLTELGEASGWQIERDHHLTKTYKLPDFRAALGLANRIGEVAEAEGHHPDLLVSWGRLRVDIWTHKIDGLTESDFVLAAKCDRAAAALPAELDHP